MSKAEKFIKGCTRNCSNEIQSPYPQIVENICKIGGDPAKEFSPWLTPDQARKAVEIARGETYDKILHWLARHINDYVVEGKGRDIDLMFDDIKQAMKDE